MKILRMRHVAIEVDRPFWDATIGWYAHLGFAIESKGSDIIDGRPLSWVKLGDGFNTIELVLGREGHIALEVDRIDEDQYYNISPDGYRIQFIRDPCGNLIELVERKEEVNAEKLHQEQGAPEDHSGDRDQP